MRVRISVAAGAVSLAVLAAFATAASAVDHFPGDQAVSTWVQSWRASWLDTVMEAASFPGVSPIAAATVALVALALYVKGLRGESGLVVAATVVSYAVRLALKAAIARPRPPEELVSVIQQADGYSFPSGHVMHFVVFLGVLAFILVKTIESGPRRWIVLGTVLVLLVTVGLSRVYLGAHWTSDVVAGYAFGGAVLAGVIWAWHRLSARGGGAPRGETPR